MHEIDDIAVDNGSTIDDAGSERETKGEENLALGLFGRF